jgi:ATP-dependent DNA helicase RecG
VKVTIQRRIVKPEVLRLVSAADERFQLTQRERITLGALALSEGMSARELVDLLELERTEDLRTWLGRLQELEIVGHTGRTKGTRYFVEPDVLRDLDFPTRTSLARIEPHRLDALVLEDLGRYPGSAVGDIQQRVGSEIKARQIKGALDRLRDKGLISSTGEKRGRKYWPGAGKLSP